MTILRIAFLEITLLDIVDILIVATIFYQLIRIFRRTQAFNMIIGLGVILFVAFVSTWFQMDSLRWLMTRVGTAWILVFLIVFQPELRNILVKIGNNPLWRKLALSKKVDVVPKLVETIIQLKQKGLGALIVFERDVGLLNYIQTGKEVNAKISSDLLLAIFTPPGPLHDGALIIREDIIAASGCTLPLTENPEYSKTLGMRHRAAIGVTEGTDAISIIVSEETHNVSIAVRGRLRRNIKPGRLKKLLDVLLEPEK